MMISRASLISPSFTKRRFPLLNPMTIIEFENVESLQVFVDNLRMESVIRRNEVYNKYGRLIAAVKKKGE